MFKDIDVRMKEFAKGMDQNNKTLATILARFLNPNATIPDSFGVAPSTLSHSHFIHSSPSIVTNNNISPATPTMVNSPATPTNVSGETVLASNSSLSLTPGSSDISFPMFMGNVTPSSLDSIEVTQESSPLDVVQSTRSVIGDAVMVHNSSGSSTPASGYRSPPMFEGNLTPPHAENASLNVAHPHRSVNSDTVVVGNSSQLLSRNTSSPSAVNFVEITQEVNTFRNPLRPGDVTGYFLAGNLISELHKNSCSRRNFSTRLVRKLFDESTRRQSNVHGKLGKSKLNPVIMDYVKSLTFQYYPLEGYESEQQEWARCVVAIDSSSRGLNKRPATRN